METSEQSNSCNVLIDLGTTNTRVWLADASGQVLARASAQVGARDNARDGSRDRLEQSLKSLIQTVTENQPKAEYVLASGMITSPQGLLAVNPISAPAGLNELAANSKQQAFPQICDPPFIFFPGIITGPAERTIQNVGQTDIMRGEETVCLGLLAVGLIQAPATVLNLGSHWKVIQIDSSGRIAGSRTSLAGEMIHALQAHTLLASSLPQGPFQTLDTEYLQAGMTQLRESDLSRAAFCVRLLELGGGGSPAQRMSYLIGAFIAAELDSILVNKTLDVCKSVTIIGPTALAEAWIYALRSVSISANSVTAVQVENATVAGLNQLLKARKIYLESLKCQPE
jgi:2-dehydro-3-deoxygalactonokinase